MAKGSQLSQLKSALTQAGITGNQNRKKRKRSLSTDKDQEKRTAKLEEIHRRLNPFDVKVTKLKHDIGGRKLKGLTGKPAQSKQHGLEQRKKTLLKEYEEKDRAGGIVDRRFGENNPTMSLEERMLERFTKERQRASKGATFNLEDEDELTHYGQSLSKLDDFDNVGLGLDSDEETAGQIDREIVRKTHFGGFGEEEEEHVEGEPDKKRSKAEVMAEVMAKSKEHKLRRQLERSQEDDVRHELDNEFAVLRDLIYAPDPSSTGSNSIPLGRQREEPFSDSNAAPDVAILALAPELEADYYDQHVRELAFDKRSKPKDRTKTEEELALEEKEALEKAERRRRKRMLGLEESASEDDTKRKGKRKRGGDDLDEDLDEDATWQGLGEGLGGVEDGAEGSGDGGDDEQVSSEGCDDSDGSSSTHLAGSGGELGEHQDIVEHTKDKFEARAAAQELPFTFSCPRNHEEFLQIVEHLDDVDTPVVIQRIRALYHTSLSPNNKFKLQTLATVLIDHILHIASPTTPRFSLISSLLPHVIAITRAYPIPSAQYFNEKLALMYKNLKRGLSRGPLDPEARTWPSLPELSLLRIIGSIWPTSDLNHAVVSPARVLMASYLGLGRIRSLTDITSGLFLCSLFLQFETLSKRLIPEVINFLINTVLHLAPHHYGDISTLPGTFPSPDFQSDLCRPLRLRGNSKNPPIPQKANLSWLISSGPSEQAKTDLLSLALGLIELSADMYKGLDAFIELYQPIAEIIHNLDGDKISECQQTKQANLNDTLRRLLKFALQARQPLRLQAHKPIPIATYVPKFETISSNYLRRQDPDHEKNEASKLRNQYKQERKGAIRELRKDARFLAGVEQQKQVEKDNAYNTRMKRVFGSIEGERAEEKAMEREKAKEKRRSGRK